MTTDTTLTPNFANPDYSAHPSRKKVRSLLTLPSLVIAGCLFFNFFLCFANTKLFGISESYVILCELLLVAGAAAYGFFRPDPARFYWLFVLIAQFVMLAMLSVFRDELLIRAFRDVLFMPVFTALGLAAAAKIDFTRPLLWLSALIAAIALFEAFFLELFTSYFSIQDYYIAKGYDPQSFSFVDADVFASGIRPGGRFFPFPFEIHRVSSVFLEPVSLGFYAFISGLYFIAMKDRLPRKQVLMAVGLTLLLIWLGDARMAFGSLILVMAFRWLFKRLDHRLTLFMFPAFLLFGLFIINSGLFTLDGQGIGARMLWTFEGIWITGNQQFFGLESYPIDMVDSGFLYLIGFQGIWGFLLYWLPPIFFKSRLSPEARVYWYGASLFLAFGLLISYAIFTIKTAALLWFCYGYIIARTSQPTPSQIAEEK